MQASLLYEVLAARQMAAGNPQIVELIGKLRASNDGGGDQTMQHVLGQLAQRNPMLAALTGQLGIATESSSNRSVEIEGNAVEVPAAQEAGAPEPRADAGADRVGVAEETPSPEIEPLITELNALRERLDRCSAALGACGACWGTDPSCRACRGRGRPGFSQPDETLFEELILPAVHMLKALRAMPSTILSPLQSQRIERSAPAEFDRDFT